MQRVVAGKLAVGIEVDSQYLNRISKESSIMLE
jgi:hypothetical protein